MGRARFAVAGSFNIFHYGFSQVPRVAWRLELATGFRPHPRAYCMPPGEEPRELPRSLSWPDCERDLRDCQCCVEKGDVTRSGENDEARMTNDDGEAGDFRESWGVFWVAGAETRE